MSRGPGRLMVAVLGVLRAASGPLAFSEIAIGMYGSRVALPAGDTANLRRALRGLVQRGDGLRARDWLDHHGRRGA